MLVIVSLRSDFGEGLLTGNTGQKGTESATTNGTSSATKKSGAISKTSSVKASLGLAVFFAMGLFML